MPVGGKWPTLGWLVYDTHWVCLSVEFWCVPRVSRVVEYSS